MGKVCAQCENFLGGGDWGLSCSKKHGLTYEYTGATNCENFTQETVCKNNGQVPIGEYVRLSREAEAAAKRLTECPMCGRDH